MQVVAAGWCGVSRSAEATTASFGGRWLLCRRIQCHVARSSVDAGCGCSVCWLSVVQSRIGGESRSEAICYSPHPPPSLPAVLVPGWWSWCLRTNAAQLRSFVSSFLFTLFTTRHDVVWQGQIWRAATAESTSEHARVLYQPVAEAEELTPEEWRYRLNGRRH